MSNDMVIVEMRDAMLSPDASIKLGFAFMLASGGTCQTAIIKVGRKRVGPMVCSKADLPPGKGMADVLEQLKNIVAYPS